jgi:23S rRNA (adenine2503-C2)-methyltransferase
LRESFRLAGANLTEMTDLRTCSLLGMDRQELAALVTEVAEPPYRAKQLVDAVYRQRVETIGEISTFPAELRERFENQGVRVGAARIENKFISGDGTVRYLIGFSDGQTVETVWMPEGDGGEAGDGTEAAEAAERLNDSTEAASEVIAGPHGRINRSSQERPRSSSGRSSSGRSTICVSSQVGCAVDCQFCLTALLGMKRNLTAGEIVGQVCAVLKDQGSSPPEARINLVFMGMGEPFLNYENFMKASRLLVECVGIAERRMTVSTAGIVPRIRDFGEETIRPKLAISLNASNDELRTRLMPLNKKWNLEMLMAAAREFPLRTKEWVTFEYVLLGGVNDAPENAREVAELLRGLRCKVNLIALNPGPGIEFATPAEKQVQEFQATLRHAGIPAFLRRPRGRDIYAACGQLKRTVEITTSPELQVQEVPRVPAER